MERRFTCVRNETETDLIERLRVILCDYEFDRAEAGEILEELDRRAFHREYNEPDAPDEIGH